MKKNWIAIVIAVLVALLPVTAMAVDMDLFDRAKSALSYISYGEYAQALEELGLKSNKNAAKELKASVKDDLSTALYGEVQTTVAMCYKVKNGYKFCVPVEDPSVGGVEALVLLSKNGNSFGGYRMAMWNDCVKESESSEDLIWCEPITKVDPVIIAD